MTEPGPEDTTPPPAEADTPDFGVEYAVEGDDSDPFFRDEPRDHLWADDAPIPPGITEPLAGQMLASARWILGFLIGLFHRPATLALQGWIQQRRKYELIDHLRPIEKLLRRLLLIEAFALAGTQSLPSSAPRQRTRVKRQPRWIELDPVHPETWPVRFRITPPKPFTGRRAPRGKLPPIDTDHFRGDPRTPLRHRRKLHDAWPLARRLEAVLRILDNPAPFIRRLAFRVSRGPAACAGIDALTVDPEPGRRLPMCHEANTLAKERLADVILAHWSSG